MNRRTIPTGSLALLIALVLLSARPAHAQVSSRPYNGVFAAQSDRDKRFDMMWSVAGAYDDNVTADQPGGNPNSQIGGTFGVVQSSVTFQNKGQHKLFTATGNVVGRYYTTIEQLNAVDGGGNIQYSSDLGSRVRLSLSQGASYQTYYHFDVFSDGSPSELPPTPSPLPPVQVAGTSGSALSAQQFDGALQLTRTLGPRSSLALEYGYRYSTLGHNGDAFFWQTGGGHFSRNLTRYAALRFGYSYSQSQSPATTSALSDVVSQSIDFGFDYARPLSFSRRTRIDVKTGSTAVTYAGERHYVMLVDGGLAREIGRTWKADLRYNRGVQFTNAVTGPMSSDAIQAGFFGLLSRHFQLNTNVAYSTGRVGLNFTDPSYVSYAGFLNLRHALTHSFALEAQYGYQKYQFDPGTPLYPGVPNNLGRQSLRFAVTGWLPMLGR